MENAYGIARGASSLHRSAGSAERGTESWGQRTWSTGNNRYSILKWLSKRFGESTFVGTFSGLLAFTASAPVHDLEDQEQVRSSTDTLNSDLLGRGTPPPSYSEVLAAISTHHLDETATEDFAISLVPGNITNIWTLARLPASTTASTIITTSSTTIRVI